MIRRLMPALLLLAPVPAMAQEEAPNAAKQALEAATDALDAAAEAVDTAAENVLPERQLDIHNHTDLTISELSLRRLPSEGEQPGAAPRGDEEVIAWEIVEADEGGPLTLESHNHFSVNWAAEECGVEFKAIMSDGTADHRTADACTERQLQFGSQFDHD